MALGLSVGRFCLADRGGTFCLAAFAGTRCGCASKIRGSFHVDDADGRRLRDCQNLLLAPGRTEKTA